MNVGNYFTQGRRGWVRLHEKGGKEHEAPCHHKLEAMLDAYLTARCLPHDPAACAPGRIETKIGNHSPRATGITDYVEQIQQPRQNTGRSSTSDRH